MRIVVLTTLLIICVVFFGVRHITGSVRDFNVTVINRAAILPDEGYSYVTSSALRFSVDGEYASVPKGFKTDLATIPRWYWSIISPARSDLITASIIHDYLYTCPGMISRLDADSIFYHALINDGVTEYVAGKMFFAVRLFGKSHFNYGIDCYPNEYQDGMDEWIPRSLNLE